MLLYLIQEVGARYYVNNCVVGKKNFDTSIRQFESVAPNLKLLCLGDSKTYYGVNLEDFPCQIPAYNFSYPSENIIAIYFKLKYYFEKDYLPNLRLVIFEFGIHSFSSDVRFYMRGFGDYYKYISLQDIYRIYGPKESATHILFKSYLLKYKDILSMDTVAKNILFHKSELISDKGSGIRKEMIMSELELRNFKSELYIKSFLKDLNVSDILIGYYLKTFKLLEQKNIKILLVRMPEFRDYYLLRHSNGNLTSLSKKEKKNLFEIRRILKTNIPDVSFNYIDLNNYYFRPSDFSDAGHLNTYGSRYASRILLKEISYIVQHPKGNSN